MKRFLLVILIVLAGCSKKPRDTKTKGLDKPAPLTDVQSAEGAVYQFNAKSASMKKVTGSSTDGNTAFPFEAFFEGTRLRMVSERADLADNTYVHRRIYFTDDGMIYFREESEQMQKERRTMRPHLYTEKALLFDGSGKLRSSRKCIQGVCVVIDPQEAQAARTRSLEVKKRAESAQ